MIKKKTIILAEPRGFCTGVKSSLKAVEKALKDFAVIMLRDRGDNPRNARRMDIVEKIVSGLGVKVIEVGSIGKGLLARIFSLIYIGDYVSFYLAMLNKCDPTPVDRITYLKRELAKR